MIFIELLLSLAVDNLQVGAPVSREVLNNAGFQASEVDIPCEQIDGVLVVCDFRDASGNRIVVMSDIVAVVILPAQGQSAWMPPCLVDLVASDTDLSAPDGLGSSCDGAFYGAGTQSEYARTVESLPGSLCSETPQTWDGAEVCTDRLIIGADGRLDSYVSGMGGQ